MTGLIPADAHDRCQKTTHSGQCSHRAIPGTALCEQHTSKLAQMRHRSRQYEIDDARLRLRVDQFAQSDAIYSLKEEIAILRQFIEGIVKSLKIDESAESRMQAAVQAPMVIRLVETLERLVKTSGTMEVRFGNMLTRETVVILANRIVQILTEEVSHIEDFEHIVDRVTSRITSEINTTKNEVPDE